MKRLCAIGLCVALMVLGNGGRLFAGKGLGPEVIIPRSVFEGLNAQKDKALSPAERKTIFDKMDTNRDGRISRAEFLSYEQAIFTRRDRNHDGMLTPDEIKTAERGYFIALDKNRTCTVTTGDCETLANAAFQAIDGQDQDGFISYEEYLAYWAMQDKAVQKKTDP